jgi:hypothetical protein
MVTFIECGHKLNLKKYIEILHYNPKSWETNTLQVAMVMEATACLSGIRTIPTAVMVATTGLPALGPTPARRTL